jgi:hypothetical protein
MSESLKCAYCYCILDDWAKVVVIEEGTVEKDQPAFYSHHKLLKIYCQNCYYEKIVKILETIQ